MGAGEDREGRERLATTKLHKATKQSQVAGKTKDSNAFISQ